MRKPDLEGFGEAWKVPITEERPGGGEHATIQHWLLKGQMWHPMWDHYVVMVIHLREIEGMNPPHKSSPDMTHELLIMALDPGHDTKKRAQYDPDNLPYPIPYLRPIDVVVQFKCDSDAKAVDVCDAVVKTILAGHASPDQDYRRYWESAIPATAACSEPH